MVKFSKNQVNYYTVNESDELQRIDNLLSKLLKAIPSSHIYRIIRSGEVRINMKRVTSNTQVQLNDRIRIPPLNFEIKSSSTSHIPNLPFAIIYQDKYYLVINKPAGIACHGGSGISFGVIEQLRKYYNQWEFLELAHRLDKETSGLLILAKKRSALVAIQELNKNNLITKKYLALTKNCWTESKRNIKLPLLKLSNLHNQPKVVVDLVNGKYAQTIFNLIENFNDCALVSAELKTGRTHQIRVHLKHINHPILGDERYGDFILNRNLTKLKRMFLHAQNLKFIHPLTQEKIKLEAPLPTELGLYLNQLKSKY